MGSNADSLRLLCTYCGLVITPRALLSSPHTMLTIPRKGQYDPPPPSHFTGIETRLRQPCPRPHSPSIAKPGWGVNPGYRALKLRLITIVGNTHSQRRKTVEWIHEHTKCWSLEPLNTQQREFSVFSAIVTARNAVHGTKCSVTLVKWNKNTHIFKSP